MARLCDYRTYEMTTKQRILDTLAAGWTPLYFYTEITPANEMPDQDDEVDESKIEWQLEFRIVMGVTWRLNDGKIEFKKCVINDPEEMEAMIKHVSDLSKKVWKKTIEEKTSSSLEVLGEFKGIKQPS